MAGRSTEDKRDILVKLETETDPDHGCRPEERSLQDHINLGIINIDKPKGPTSHQLTSWARDIVKAKKAGHSGTLDPKVTGVQPIALGDATKIIKVLLLSDKEYICLMALHADVKRNRLDQVLNEFKGKIFQVPPQKSAVKRDLRVREIYEMEYLEREEHEVLFRVKCEAGTYIRKLCHDIGLVLGTGAHMKELRRTKAGPFDESTLVTMHDLKDAYETYLEDGKETDLRKLIQPIENGVRDLKGIWVKDGAISAICHGASLNAPGISKIEQGIKKGELVAIYSLKNELVALAKTSGSTQEMYELERGEAAKPGRIIMDPDTYPKIWRKRKDAN